MSTLDPNGTPTNSPWNNEEKTEMKKHSGSELVNKRLLNDYHWMLVFKSTLT